MRFEKASMRMSGRFKELASIGCQAPPRLTKSRFITVTSSQVQLGIFYTGFFASTCHYVVGPVQSCTRDGFKNKNTVFYNCMKIFKTCFGTILKLHLYKHSKKAIWFWQCLIGNDLDFPDVYQQLDGLETRRWDPSPRPIERGRRYKLKVETKVC